MILKTTNVILILAVILISMAGTASEFQSRDDTPVITEVIGDLNNGNVVTIRGSGFGIKEHASPLISSFDDPNPANNWNTGVIGGNWSTRGTNISLSNESPRAEIYQSSYKLAYNNSYPDYDNICYNHMYPDDKIYVSFWLYRDHPTLNMTTGQGNNAKFLRIYQSSSTSDGNLVYSLGCNDTGGPERLFASGDNLGTNENWSIAYTACNAGKYTRSWFSVSTSEPRCLPKMQRWEHYEFYIDYPSELGGTDSYNVIWKDGITVARSINISVNQPGQTNDRRFILVGQVSGGYNPAYMEYVDQLYIDNTQAHVFISNASDVTWPDYGHFHHSEIQVARYWSDNEIRFVMNFGSFPNGSHLYLYVVNPNGSISNAYPIILGSSNVPELTVEDVVILTLLLAPVAIVIKIKGGDRK